MKYQKQDCSSELSLPSFFGPQVASELQGLQSSIPIVLQASVQYRNWPPRTCLQRTDEKISKP